MDTNTYEVILRDGVLFYHYADGTTLPLIAGAAEGEGGAGGGTGDGQGSGDGGTGSGTSGGESGAGTGGGEGGGSGGGTGGEAGTPLTLADVTKMLTEAGSNLDAAAFLRELERTRKEAATHRVSKNEANKKVEELTKQFNNIKKHLGLGDDEQDPEKLKAEVSRIQADLRQERMRNAFHRVAGKAGADIELTWAMLFASGDLSNIEGDGDELDRAIEERVKAAIAANPKLKASQMPSKGGGDFSGNGGGGGDKPDMNRLIRAAAGRK